MKPEQQLNLTKETQQPQKHLTMTSCPQIVMSLSFFRFMPNLEQSEAGFRTHGL